MLYTVIKQLSPKIYRVDTAYKIITIDRILKDEYGIWLYEYTWLEMHESYMRGPSIE